MTKTLTTGEMIDKLKVGEVAEGSTHWEVEKVEGVPGIETIIELNSGDEITLTGSFLTEKWTILPNYVSFDEAFNANKNHTVFFHGNTDYSDLLDDPIKCNSGWLRTRRISSLDIGVYSMRTLVEGKWSVGETQ